MATQARNAAGVGTGQGGIQRATPYAYYALFLLILANLFNYLDRQIVSILAPAIQAELHLTDTQLGFLLGTAFSVLYGVLGIPMGRIADALSRTRLMAFGLALWSAMTAVGAGATSFFGLGVARIGVGVGEATASPVAHSLLCDYFPARNRAAVLGTYLASVHLGIGGSLVLGGLLIQNWSQWCHSFPGNACSLSNWRASFLIVGIPGLLLAILIAFLREPPRPAAHVAVPARTLILNELSAAIPPFTLFTLARVGGQHAVKANLAFLAVLTITVVGLASVTGDWAQWIAVGIGGYSITTWAQVLRHVDRPLYALTFGCPTFMFSMLGGAFLTCFVGTVSTWAAPYAMRTLPGTAGQIGIALGLAQLGSAAVSVIVGGFLSDWWKRRDRRAPIWIALVALAVPVPMLFVLLSATTLGGFIAAFCVLTFFSMSWPGAFAGLVQDLVLVRMRGAAAAIFTLVMIVISSGFGPYWAGKISTMTGSLTTGLYGLLAFVPLAAAMLIMAARRIGRETPEVRVARATAAGEIG
ncbi:MFS transporter [Sphingomonas sp. SUN039]|uniref:MFS transporter n=1 Tax=Sphingomonas sp. SUN039 TaxID=2937787 RepID=UPI0021645EA3|nr:MFS transporter [Sphingomonas sp. SUN039]UVO53627.1 MFS transporter [Sphingomonas sp. SUN039]